MLRIDVSESQAAHTVRVEGRLAGEWVEELRRVSVEALRAGAPLRLDLRGLLFADGRGIALLQELRARGADLRHGSAFIVALVQGGSDVSDR